MLQKEYNIRQIPGFVQGFGLFILMGKKKLQASLPMSRLDPA